MIETIKDYLVSLGFQVDKSSYDQAKKSMDSFDKGVQEFVGEATVLFAKAATAIAAFGAAVVAGTAKFLDGLGNQEIQMEMLSRQLWTTQQQAMAFNATLKAMGANLQDLYLSPTLMNQYNQLHAMAMEMQTPSDYKDQVQLIQSVSLQFKQLKLEAYYALQWIGYYFIKYMSGPISNVKNVLQSINQVIIKNMPTWTKRVAEVMASFVQAGIHIIQALGSVYDWLQKMLAYMPGWAKGIAAALAVLSLSNPFFMLVEAIGGAILLIDDFETYLHGGKSALGPFWSWLDKINKEFQKMNGARHLGEDIATTFSDLAKVFQNVGTWFLNMVDTLTKDGTLTAYLKSMNDLWSSTGQLVQSVVTALGDLFGALTSSKNKSAMQNFGQLMTDIISLDIKLFAGAIEEIAGFIKLAADALGGHWKQAGKDLQDMFTGQNLANLGIIPQNWVMGNQQGNQSGAQTGNGTVPSYIYPRSGHVANTTKTVQAPVHAPVTVTQNIYGNPNPSSVGNAVTQALQSHPEVLADALRGAW